MKRPPVTPLHIEHVSQALHLLRHARAELRAAGARRSALYVSRALKSAEGAERHARRMAAQA